MVDMGRAGHGGGAPASRGVVVGRCQVERCQADPARAEPLLTRFLGGMCFVIIMCFVCVCVFFFFCLGGGVVAATPCLSFPFFSLICFCLVFLLLFFLGEDGCNCFFVSCLLCLLVVVVFFFRRGREVGGGNCFLCFCDLCCLFFLGGVVGGVWPVFVCVG